MIRLKVFISSVQKELEKERQAVGRMLATDPFLATSVVPRLFDKYPAPLRPNKQAYLELLRTCHIYLLIVGREYGAVQPDGCSATHQEYNLARELELPTLICVKGAADFKREERGTGIRRMREIMQQRGLPPPAFAVRDDEFVATLMLAVETPDEAPAAKPPAGSSRPPIPVGLSESQAAIVDAMMRQGFVTTSWCVKNLGLSRVTAWRMLQELVENGLAASEGTGRGTKYRKTSPS